MKKLLCLICSVPLVFSLAGCGSSPDSGAATADPGAALENPDTAQSNSTITGQVISMDGSTVTLQLGELTEADLTRTSGDMPAGNTPPDGSENGEMPSMPAGAERPEGEPSGTAPDAQQSAPAGGAPENGGDMPSAPDAMGGTAWQFTAGEGTVTLDLSTASVTLEAMGGESEGTLSDIAVDAVLVVETDDTGAAATVTLKSVRVAIGRALDAQQAAS